MIKNNEPLSMAEALEYVKQESESGKEIVGFIKKFAKIKPADAKKLRKKLQEMDIIKINNSGICKIIDFLPDNAEDLNKVLPDANLNEDETKKILDAIKEFK